MAAAGAGSRSVLPIPHRVKPGLTTYDARDPDTAFPPIEPLRPPGGPNVLVILLDDIGFRASTTTTTSSPRPTSGGSPWPAHEVTPARALGRVAGCRWANSCAIDFPKSFEPRVLNQLSA